MQTGDYSEAEVSGAFQTALASVADLVALREKHETYAFRDLLLEEMLRVPADRMRCVETVADAALFGIIVCPVALPTRFSPENAAQACRALGRMSDDVDMAEPYGGWDLTTSDEGARSHGGFNYGESPSTCDIVHLLSGEPSGISGDTVPVWSLWQMWVEDERIGGDAFEIAYMHYPFETAIRDLPIGSHPAITDPSRIKALSSAR